MNRADQAGGSGDFLLFPAAIVHVATVTRPVRAKSVELQERARRVIARRHRAQPARCRVEGRYDHRV